MIHIPCPSAEGYVHSSQWIQADEETISYVLLIIIRSREYRWSNTPDSPHACLHPIGQKESHDPTTKRCYPIKCLPGSQMSQKNLVNMHTCPCSHFLQYSDPNPISLVFRHFHSCVFRSASPGGAIHLKANQCL